ncbi:hypothetical protein TD95_000753 [Thielaviopsis punctulata]|uniref:Anaphase-promoting complex subunit 1 N-terminal domain-containing protein n=1 Tax=Thielaviopsis punctulata TaxID=72032 RepID=A0A0F4ZJY2_9PEZI|nr:hypothetical protein TD95_000753 [Thielaviopsis punctulata]
MAQSRFLGIHQPAAFQHAIDQQILPSSPSSSDYDWHLYFDVHSDSPAEDELLVTKHTVIWSRGTIFRKTFDLSAEKEDIRQALITSFPKTSERSASRQSEPCNGLPSKPHLYQSPDCPDFTTVPSDKPSLYGPSPLKAAASSRNNPPTKSASPKPTSKKSSASTSSSELPKLSKALVVFLKTQAHIFFLSGASHIVHMPFEVEVARPLPQGLLIQRKRTKAEAACAAASMRVPLVPPNSFASTQPSFKFDSPTPSQSFTCASLGRPPVLTVGNDLHPLVQHPSSHWPRLVTLLDPLLELGLVVVTRPEPLVAEKRKPQGSLRPAFLDVGEEIIDIQKVSSSQLDGCEQLLFAVTINRETSCYSIWRVRYLSNDDPFIKNGRTAAQVKIDRRRSSMAPGYAASGAGPVNQDKTPVRSGFRESFGVTLPGKRTRKSAEKEKALQQKQQKQQKNNHHQHQQHQQHQHQHSFVASLERERDPVMTRRQSKRLSSLARVDMPASQERSVFAESAQTAKQRIESFSSSNNNRHSGAHNLGHTEGNVNVHAHNHAYVDSILDDLRSAGDFDSASFHGFGAHPESEYEGLAQELSFSLVKTLDFCSNSRNSIYYPGCQNPESTSPLRIFSLVYPPSFSHMNAAISIILAIQDPVECQLDMITIPTSRHARSASSVDTLTLGPIHHHRASGIADSCKIVDGDSQIILILSDESGGARELSIQSPWTTLTNIELPAFGSKPRGLGPRTPNFSSRLRSKIQEGGDLRPGGYRLRSEQSAAESAQYSLISLRPRLMGGLVDVVDNIGRVHQLHTQLQPTNTQVQAILNVCRLVIPDGRGEMLLCGWWHAMRWIRAEGLDVADHEWSALIILLLSMIMSLSTTAPGPTEPSVHSTPSRRRRRPPSATASQFGGQNWAAMQMHTSANASAVPSWLLTSPWSWAMDHVSPESIERSSDHFFAAHIRYAARFLTSTPGVTALGADGYLPTALSFPLERRMAVAQNMLVGIHLLVEEQKLDVCVPESGLSGRAGTRVFLAQVTRWVGWKDMSATYELGVQEALDPRFDHEISLPMELRRPDINLCIFTWIQARLTGDRSVSFPSLIDVLETAVPPSPPPVSRPLSPSLHALAKSMTPRTTQFRHFFSLLRADASFADTVEAMYNAGFTSARSFETLPDSIIALLRDPIAMCQAFPRATWSKELLLLVNRADIGMILDTSRLARPHVQRRPALTNASHFATWDLQLLCKNTHEDPGQTLPDSDATSAEHQLIIRHLFGQDRRLNDAHELLSTFRARTVTLRPRPEWVESVYLEKQKDLVSRIALGTLAIPVGRGLLYYGLRFPLPTQKTAISGFNLNCIVKPAGVTVGVDRTLFTEEKVCWSFFHQGVAAGLAISPKAKGIDTSWILYNKPSQDLSNRHAGFLLGLGLNGHLTNVAKWVSFKYLTHKHNMTSIGLLLGLAASHLGTMNSLITRLLSVHVTRMLPRGAAELNLSPMTQTTGIMGIGMLYYNTQHRRMSEIMLSEILHSPENGYTSLHDEYDASSNTLRSEGYRLASGFALGLINLAKGADLKGLHDMDVTNRLLTVATSPKRVEYVNILDRSAAGAIVALALIHMKTEDPLVAAKINVPDSIVQFDYVRPDLLLLRTLARHLILWSGIKPQMAWVRQSLPWSYRRRLDLSTTVRLTSSDLAFYSILGGLCFAIGLRYAGSANTEARDLLIYFLDHFTRLLGLAKGRVGNELGVSCYDEELARHSLRTCQDITVLSAACVMAGTGDIIVLRRLRALHGRTDPDVPYGSHMAAHMAIGILFLGCGSMTLGSSNLAVASLLISLYPVFPATVMDNRAHLQAFRHLWVMGVEARCVVVKDVATGNVAPVPITVTLKPDKSDKDQSSLVVSKTTPCLLPPLHTIASIRTHGSPIYWDAELSLVANPDMAAAFAQSRTIHLRKRPATDMPFGSTAASHSPNIHLQSRHPVPGLGPATDANPFSWIFGLESLKHLSAAERVTLLDLDSTGGEGAIGASCLSSVDIRLDLEHTPALSRDDMLGLRLLFEWCDVREEMRDREIREVKKHHGGGQRKGQQNNADDEKKRAELMMTEWWVKENVVRALRVQIMSEEV